MRHSLFCFTERCFYRACIAENNNGIGGKEAGIVAADMAKVIALIKVLSVADDDQSGSVYDRKAATKSKNVLQASPEYGITRYSAQGILEFKTSNPALAISFAELILNSTKAKTKTTTKTDGK